MKRSLRPSLKEGRAAHLVNHSIGCGSILIAMSIVYFGWQGVIGNLVPHDKTNVAPSHIKSGTTTANEPGSSSGSSETPGGTDDGKKDEKTDSVRVELSVDKRVQTDKVVGISVSPNGKAVAITNSYRCTVRGLPALDSLLVYPDSGDVAGDHIDTAAFSPDSKYLILCGSRDSGNGYSIPNNIHVFDTSSYMSYDTQPSGAKFLCGFAGTIASFNDGSTYDVATKKVTYPTQPVNAKDGSTPGVVSPDGAFEERMGLMNGFAWMDRGSKKTFSVGDDLMKNGVFSPDSRFVAAGRFKGFKVLKAGTGDKVADFQLDAAFDSCAFLPNTRFIAVGTEDGKVSIWDTEQSKVVTSISCDSGEEPLAMTCSPDGNSLIVGTEKQVYLLKVSIGGK